MDNEIPEWHRVAYYDCAGNTIVFFLVWLYWNFTVTEGITVLNQYRSAHAEVSLFYQISLHRQGEEYALPRMWVVFEIIKRSQSQLSRSRQAMGGFFWKEQCFGKGYLEAEGDSYCCWSVLMSQPLLCRIGCIQEVTWLRSNAERGLSSWRQEIFVGQSLKNIRFSKNVHGPGIEPGPPAWQARILPLNHPCLSV